MTIDPWILAFSAVTVVATIWMGFWAARRSKTTSDFFVAGRSVSVGWNASAISGEYLSAASFMGVAGMVMSSGYDALWYPVCYACGYLFLLLFIAGPLRRFGAYTVPDLAEGRFDSPLFRKIAVVFVLFIGFFYTMPQMKGAGTTLAYIFPGLPYWVGVVLVGAVITLNVALGGMKGITLVQAFQYWAKMFAISLPIFVLMAVYGHYGTQLKANSRPVGKSLTLIPLREALQASQFKPDEEIDQDIPELLRRYSSLAGSLILVESSITNAWNVSTPPSQVSEAALPAVLESSLAERGIRLLHCDNEVIVVPSARFDELKETYDNVGLMGLTKSNVPNRFRFSYTGLVRSPPSDQRSSLGGLWRSMVTWFNNRFRPSPISLLPPVMESRQLGTFTFAYSVATQRPVWTDPALHSLSYSDDRYNLLNITLTNLTPRGVVRQLRGEFLKRGIALIEFEEGTLLVPQEKGAYYRSLYDREGMYPFSDQELSGRMPLPAKAPMDETWLSPFGPLTTKAAKAANASVRWNLSAENRAALRDFSGRQPQAGFRGMIEKAGEFVEEIGGKKAATPVVQFSDWTNMPPNTSRSIPAGFPMLSTLREYGLLMGRPVMVATNLPRPKLVLSGSFHSRDEFLRYLDALLLTNGVRLVFEQEAIKVLAASDWETYQKTPGKISFVPNRFFGMRVNTDIKALAYQYGAIGEGGHTEDNLEVLFATNFPTRAVDFNSNYDVLLVHEARPQMEKYLADRGVTLIHSSSREVWAVPTLDMVRYQMPPVNVRGYSLLYTYSLIIALVCGTAGLPHILVRFYTNPDGVAAKRTTMWVMILIGIFYVFPPVFGVMGRNLLPELYAGVGAKGTDKIVLELPRLLNKNYAPLGSILSGITCAGAFAAFMSTFSGLLVSMTGAMAHDVYGRMLNPKATSEQRLRAFKIAAVGVGGVAILLGTLVEPLQINFMVGQAFAIAAASYFPLLFMCAWWRNLTMKGAATGMLTGGLLAVAAISLTSFSDLAQATDKTAQFFAVFKPMAGFWAAHPLLRILCEQPAIWCVPLALTLMFVVSRLTRREVPADIRMKMLVLHAPEKLGLKQEYIQEHQHGH